MSEYLASRPPGVIGEREWQKMLSRFAPVSTGYLRRLLRAAGVPMVPMVEGIRQDDFESLERTLLAMEKEYGQARTQGQAARQLACRQAVIEAKDHARWSIRRPNASPEKKAMKQEMVGWMLVWLDNPEVFPAWVRLRKEAAGERED